VFFLGVALQAFDGVPATPPCSMKPASSEVTGALEVAEIWA
jgi:hypothetical protein